VGRRGVFLSAEWRYLAMLNYAVDPNFLAARVPPGTELDFFEGRTFVSLVAFRFLRTRVLGARIPLHENFEEVNLRFYVRRPVGDGWHRGVVFIRELVPKLAIALVARIAYNENYVALHMTHEIRDVGDNGTRRVSADYSWHNHRAFGRVQVHAGGTPVEAPQGSLEAFITEHYWGYTPNRSGGALEYEVRHDPWRLWTDVAATFSGEVAPLYGQELSQLLAAKPVCAILAEGSPVSVYFPLRVT
jgi:uncharacterized protein